MDAGGTNNKGLQPVKNANPPAGLFIISFVMVGPFFVLNIVIGVIIEKFNQVSGRALLTEDQKLYRDTMLVVKLSDSSPILRRPEGYVRGVCYDIATNAAFETLVLVLICVNSGLMAAEHCGQGAGFQGLLDGLNLIFVVIFTLELTIRIVAMDFGPFFADNWNIMDFVIVVGCLLMIPLQGSVNLQAIRPNPNPKSSGHSRA